MSKRYLGGFITANPTIPTASSASGSWSLEQQFQYASTWPFGGPFNYIEDVFSTWLYTGNGSGQTITNGVNLSGQGGMVWIKDRSDANYYPVVFDTNRGVSRQLFTNVTNSQNFVSGYDITQFNSNGFTLGLDSYANKNNSPIVSWTFRKQPKFFDVVTFTGTAGNSRTVTHNLGSVPGMIIVKRTSGTSDWLVCHRATQPTNPYQATLKLNTTDAFSADGMFGNVNSTSFDVYTSDAGTYVAYVFAHNAGGFGLSGNDNVISCGSYTGNGTTGNTVTLGYEPQWVLIKRVDASGSWILQDVMRGMSNTSLEYLLANTSDAASNDGVPYLIPTATGFTLNSNAAWNASGGTYIYMAIRRGPMKVPTLGTSVFSPTAQNVATGTLVTTNFPIDMQIGTYRDSTYSGNHYVSDRLRGVSTTTTQTGASLVTSNTNAEGTSFQTLNWGNTGYGMANNLGSVPSLYLNFRRAPGFFDVVCYTGTGSLTGVPHNLGVTPELKIIKRRNFATDWIVGGSILGENAYLFLNTTAALTTSSNYWDGGDDSATVFSVRNTNSMSDSSGGTYIAYLFASCPGVSKVGSYTGNGSSQTINCGFSNGARFVLIKRTDSTGDWYVWDSARGIIASNDPYLLLNSTAAEVTNTDFVDVAASGFEISSTAPAAINANGGTFIFLAIA